MKCPGQDSRYWKPGAVFETECPQCGNEVEFFKDDTTRTCKKCGHRFLNPHLDFGCASYCQYAEQCVGNLPPELIAQKENLLKDRVAIEMKRFHKNDFKKIGHATRVARYAERLGKEERGNLAVILIASYLLSIPLKRTEPSIPKTPPGFQEDEGRPVAKEILTRLGAKDDLINDVCEIIRRHHQLPRFPENMDAKIVYDADRIAELEVEQKDHPLSGDELARIIDETLLTESGRKLAASVLGIAPPTT